jgi:hypothetical protein
LLLSASSSAVSKVAVKQLPVTGCAVQSAVSKIAQPEHQVCIKLIRFLEDVLGSSSTAILLIAESGVLLSLEPLCD